VPAVGADPAQPAGRYDKLSRRFLYSQYVLWSSSVSSDLAVMTYEGVDPAAVYRWDQWQKTFSEPPIWDEDHWSWNYMAHPVMGSLSYLSFRDRGGSWLEGFLGTALNSVIYEYVIIGAVQQPSYNDMIVTPISGALIGEGIYRMNKRFVRDRYLNVWERIAVTICDPYEVVFHRFNYSRMARRAYR